NVHFLKLRPAVKLTVFGSETDLTLRFLPCQCFLSTCRLYEYHYISENKTWSEAQSYCREKYTDLATVYDMTDMKRLLDSTENQGEAWIGLYNQTDSNRTWHWSLPGVEYNESEAKWLEGQKPDNETFNFICSKF
uniref:C-type lectin domain-containing protein n=1 Tax=Lates calcarifer TaxID=8187 RepID=A0A4W6EH96_LATCA